jgi:SAM-dependent methyltransferase
MSAMSTPYRVMYRLGFRPWDNGRIPEPLTALVEGPEALPPGRALDLGCGTGTHSVYLARHGWDVTGIDVVPRAITMAGTKAAAAGVHPTFVVGGISHLTELITVRDYALVLDVACFHGLPAGKRHETADQITQVSKSGAVFLLFAFGPGHRGPLPRGIDSEEVMGLFGANWDLLWQRESTDARLPGPLKHARPTGFCLRKR